MDALQMAQDALRRADNIRNNDNWRGDREAPSLYKATEAAAYAAVAQAEAAQRQAAALERIAAAWEAFNGKFDLLMEVREWNGVTYAEFRVDVTEK